MERKKKTPSPSSRHRKNTEGKKNNENKNSPFFILVKIYPRAKSLTMSSYCQRCDRSFVDHRSLGQHYDFSGWHNICPCCPADFVNRPDLAEHLTTQHSVCDCCGSYFSDETACREHMYADHRYCKPCRRDFDNAHNLRVVSSPSFSNSPVLTMLLYAKSILTQASSAASKIRTTHRPHSKMRLRSYLPYSLSRLPTHRRRRLPRRNRTPPKPPTLLNVTPLRLHGLRPPRSILQ